MKKIYNKMNKLFLLIVTLTIANNSFAEQLDGLAIFDFLIWFLLIGVVCLFGLLISAISRFTRKEYKVSIPLNFFASVLSVCALISIGNLKSGIDPGFLTFCIGNILLSLLLVILNYRIGIKNNR